MKTYTFKKAIYRTWRNDYAVLCGGEVRKWVAVPVAAKKLYITINNRSSKEAYKYKLRPYKTADRKLIQPDIMLQLKKGDWINSYAGDLEDYAWRDKWSKTGYIKVQYSE
jgi:hypothetical protein